MTLKVEKVDASAMKDGSFSTSGGGSFNIPGVDNLLSGKVGTDNAILDVQVTMIDNDVKLKEIYLNLVSRWSVSCGL